MCQQNLHGSTRPNTGDRRTSPTSTPRQARRAPSHSAQALPRTWLPSLRRPAHTVCMTTRTQSRDAGPDDPTLTTGSDLPAVTRLRRYRTDLIVTAFALTTLGLLADVAALDSAAYFMLLGAMSIGAVGAIVWALSALIHLGSLIPRERTHRGSAGTGRTATGN